MTNITKRGGPKKLDGKERINSDIKINKISEPLFKNVSFEAKKIIEKIEGAGIDNNDDIEIDKGK